MAGRRPGIRKSSSVNIAIRGRRYLSFSPFDKKSLYLGTQFVMKTMDGGLHWETISPDLTGAAKPAREKRGAGNGGEFQATRIWRGLYDCALTACTAI